MTVESLAARLTSTGAAMLAASTLVDSGVEHYRGGFANPAIAVPLVMSGLSAGIGRHRSPTVSGFNP